MEVQVVRHNGCAQDAYSNVEHAGVGEDAGRRHQAPAHDGRQFRPREHYLNPKNHGDDGDQTDDQRFDVAESPALQQQDEQHIGAGDAYAPQQGNAEQQLQSNGRADDFCQITGGDGDFAQHPQGMADGTRKMIAASLGQIALGGDAEFKRQALQQDGEQVRQHHYKQQGVVVAGAGGEVGGPVAGVHVADGNQKSGAGKGQHLAKNAGTARHFERGVHARQAGHRGQTSPGGRLGCHDVLFYWR